MAEMILVVDDETEIADLVEVYLKNEGYLVQKATCAAEALRITDTQPIALALLDVMLPDMDGFALCRKIRENHLFPIIMLTAKTEDTDKITGLTLGADDYITKPFNPVEVIARVKSQLRRYMQLGSGQIKKDAIVIGGIELNDNSKQVTVDGELVSLTPTEYDILRLLMEHPGQVFSPRDIYKEVWKETPLGAEGSVAVHIRHLREKIEINPGEPRYIKVIWGRGYKMEYQ